MIWNHLLSTKTKPKGSVHLGMQEDGGEGGRQEGSVELLV